MACSLSVSVSSECGGAYETKHPNAMSIPVLSCKKDVGGYLHSIGASGARGRNAPVQVTEVDLILNRAGFFVYTKEQISNMTICPHHRKLLTVNWPACKAVTCRYPSHQKRRARTKWSAKSQRISKLVSEEIFWMYNAVVPIGEGKSYKFQIISM